MPRKNRKKGGWFYNCKFSDKVAIMYGSIFTIIVLVICTMVTINGIYGYLNMRKMELQELSDVLAREVEDHGQLTQKEIADLNLGKDIVVKIVDITPLDPKPDFHGSIPAGVIRNENIDMYDLSGRGAAAEGMYKKDMFARFMTNVEPANYQGKNYLIFIERTFSSEFGIIKTFITAFILITIVGVCGAIFTGRYISKRMLRPIIDITDTAAAIGFEDLSRRIEYDGPDDEIKVLADTFNEMIDRLEIAFDRQTQFISDASHELRTPISVIQGYANLMDRWGKEDPAIVQESIDSIKGETQHMTTLIRKMLGLAKFQETTSLENAKIISLNSVVLEIKKEIEVMDISHKIVYNDGDECFILGDFGLIKQMIWIFLENSLKYSDSTDGPIMIEVFKENDKAVITIEDSGIGINNDDLPHIFERFYRADKSRSKEVPGTGIGLSVAELIIKQHNGKVKVLSEELRGTKTVVKFACREN